MHTYTCVRTISRWLAVVTVLALAGTVLSGCVDVNVESDFTAVAKPQHAFQVTIDKSAIAQLNQLGGDNGQTSILTNQDEARKTAESKGYAYTAIDNDQQQGSHVSKTFADPAATGADLNAMFNDNATDPTAAKIDGFAGGLTKFGNIWKLDLAADSDKIFQSTPTDGSTQQLPPETLNSIFTFVYTAKLPGKVTETNGAILPDGRVQWKLPLTGTTQLTASAQAGGGGGGNWPLIIGSIAGIVIVAGIAGLLLMRRQRGNLPPTGPAVITTTDAVPPFAPAPEARVIELEPMTEPDIEDVQKEPRDPEAETRRLPGTTSSNEA